MLADAKAAYDRGDYQTALKLMAAAAITIKNVRSCFAAGTPIRTPYGYKFIEAIRADDWVLSSDEHDPAMLPIAKRVVEIFQRHALILHLHLADRSGEPTRLIRTTAEHPFWVHGKGWTAAKDLQPGDRLRTLDESELLVE